MIPPYLNPDCLFPRMEVRPLESFFVRPGDYSVVDGDTFRILAPPPPGGGRRDEAFRIRLPSVNTPELLKPSLFDRVLDRGGTDCHRTGPGELVRDILRLWCARRAILVDPVLRNGTPQCDRYGRLLAGVHVSGRPGLLFDPCGAWSVEPELIRHGLAVCLSGQPPPDPDPPVLRSLRAALDHLEADRVATRSRNPFQHEGLVGEDHPPHPLL